MKHTKSFFGHPCTYSVLSSIIIIVSSKFPRRAIHFIALLMRWKNVLFKVTASFVRQWWAQNIKRGNATPHSTAALTIKGIHCFVQRVSKNDIFGQKWVYVQGWAKKLVTGLENSSAQSQPAQACHARLVLNKTVTFLCTTLYTFGLAILSSVWPLFKLCAESLPLGSP